MDICFPPSFRFSDFLTRQPRGLASRRIGEGGRVRTDPGAVGQRNVVLGWFLAGGGVGGPLDRAFRDSLGTAFHFVEIAVLSLNKVAAAPRFAGAMGH